MASDQEQQSVPVLRRETQARRQTTLPWHRDALRDKSAAADDSRAHEVRAKRVRREAPAIGWQATNRVAQPKLQSSHDNQQPIFI